MTATFGAELDALREEVLASLGSEDAAYIRRLIRIQRGLDAAGRAALLAGLFPPAWFVGTSLLSVAKILENMEIGHNVMHAQWDWMRDDEIHSTTWEWDTACPSSQWKHSHNHLHHQWTNVEGMDRDIGYGILRVFPHQPWGPARLAQPLYFLALAALFQYGVALHDVENDLGSGKVDGWRNVVPKLKEVGRKVWRQWRKDYLVLPALALPFGGPAASVAAASGAATANLVRNMWAFAVIFCGHFPHGAQVIDPAEVEGETREEWYRRQVLGSANFEGGALMHLMSGHLDHQIEHHLFPDLPSNRYAEIGPRVREICERHGVPYNTGSFAAQFGSVVRRVVRLSLP